MPTYEFTCPDGHDFDKFFRSMAAAPTVVPCPVCGKPADRQMSAGAGLVFHGTGFYITDYGKDGKKDQKPAPHRHSESKHGSDSEPKASVGEPSSHTGHASGGSGASDSSTSGSSSESATKPSPDSSSSASATPTKPATSPKASE